MLRSYRKIRDGFIREQSSRVYGDRHLTVGLGVVAQLAATIVTPGCQHTVRAQRMAIIVPCSHRDHRISGQHTERVHEHGQQTVDLAGVAQLPGTVVSPCDHAAIGAQGKVVVLPCRNRHDLSPGKQTVGTQGNRLQTRQGAAVA